MCFNISITKFSEYLEKRFKALLKQKDIYKAIYNASAFSFPLLPVIVNNFPQEIRFLNWGLIPFWAKNETAAHKIRSGTLNARADTLSEKPSFRHAIRLQRCLVLVDGFFEWHENNGKKYPFYIRLKNRDAFALAGLWDRWENPSGQKILNTFSIITTDANPLLAQIHNTKKRMPVILNPADEEKWLKDNPPELINALLKPYDDSELEAYPVDKNRLIKNKDPFDPMLIEPFVYPEIDFTR